MKEIFFVFSVVYVFIKWGFFWGILGLFGLAPYFLAYDCLKFIFTGSAY